MSRKDQYIDRDNTYYEPSTDPSGGTMLLVVLMTILMVILTTVLGIIYFKKNDITERETVIEATGETDSIYISVASPTPTPVQPLALYQNPLLYPATALVSPDLSEQIDPSADPSSRGLTQTVFDRSGIINDFSREYPIYMGDPLEYGDVSGILTFRGNNFRNSAAYGYTNITEGSVTQVWEFSDVGYRLGSDMATQWTGFTRRSQPLIVRWPAEMRNSMNIYESAASKPDLVEVIVAGRDGKVYFFDLDDGTPTRDPIIVGASIFGTPALDPRGYPLLYLGQGDDNGDMGFGMYIYSLIDGSRLYYYGGGNDGGYRQNWNGFDSSPIIDSDADTLIWPCENGIIYTFKLNTNYSLGSVSVSPQLTGYKYIFSDTPGAMLGVESSIAVYGGYGYFTDNCADLICLDLNTMRMVWSLKLGDDTDITPVIDEENGVPFVYVGTEVDEQGGTGDYSGAAYIYKINGLTGEIVWQNSFPCYTYNGETSDSDQSGGCFGNIIIGKRSISNLVIFSFAGADGIWSGNMIVAYDKDLGTEVWRYHMNKYSYSSPVDIYDEEGNAYIAIGDSIGQIHLIHAESGWTDEERRVTYIQTMRFFDTDSPTSSGFQFEGSPAVFENMLIIGTQPENPNSTSGASVFGIRIE
ncbi:MAG: PQQ-like beta-propeller repeat protein [Clostridiales bacterium]|nr:PQQ-like beta-propeller repeat protein [Clostridiales bacterium]